MAARKLLLINEACDPFCEVGGVAQVTHALRRHITDADVVENASLLLRFAMWTHVPSRDACIAAGGPEAFAEALAGFKGRLYVQQSVLGALCKLLQAPAASAPFAATGVAPLVSAIKDHVTDQRCANFGSDALCSLLTHHEPARALCNGSEGPSVLVCILNAYTATDVGIVRQAMAATRRLLVSCSSGPFCAAGGVRSATSALRGHMDDAAFVEHACMVLTYCCWVDVDARLACISAGGPTILLDVLQRYKGQTAVVRSAIAAIRKLANASAALGTLGLADSIGILCAALDAQIADTKSAEHGCAVIHEVLANAPASARYLASCGGAAVIASVLARHAGDATMVRSAVSIAKLLAVDAPTQADFAKARGLHALVHVLATHAADPVIVEAGCELLGALIQGGTGRDDVPPDTLSVLAQVLRAHGPNKTIAGNACALVCFLIVAGAERTAFRDEADIGALCSALLLHTSDADIVEDAAAALASILASDEAAAASFVACDGVSPLIAALQAHLQSRNVARTLLLACRNMLTHPGARPAFTAAGGCKVVIIALRIHNEDAACAEHGSAAMCSALSDDTAIHATVDAGGPAAFTVALQRHSASVVVMQWLLAAISNMLSYDAARVAWMEAGGSAALVTAIEAHITDARCVEHGFAALSNAMAMENDAPRASFAAVGGPELIAHVLRTHAGELSIVRAAIAAAANMLNAAEVTAAPFRASGCIPSIVNALRMHLEDARCLEQGCTLLWNAMLADSESRKACLDAGAPELFTSMLRTKEGDIEVVRATFGAASAMSVVPEAAAAFCRFGGIHHIVTTLLDYVEDSDCMIDGCTLLCNVLSSDPGARKAFLEAEGQQLMHALLDVHGASVDIVRFVAAMYRSLVTSADNCALLASGGIISALLSATEAHRTDASLLNDVFIGLTVAGRMDKDTCKQLVEEPCISIVRGFVGKTTAASAKPLGDLIKLVGIKM